MKYLFLACIAVTVGVFLGFESRYGAADAFYMSLIPIIITAMLGKQLMAGNQPQGQYFNDIVLR
jgi:hypothetical protein